MQGDNACADCKGKTLARGPGAKRHGPGAGRQRLRGCKARPCPESRGGALWPSEVLSIDTLYWVLPVETQVPGTKAAFMIIYVRAQFHHRRIYQAMRNRQKRCTVVHRIFGCRHCLLILKPWVEPLSTRDRRTAFLSVLILKTYPQYFLIRNKMQSPRSNCQR